MSSDSGSADTGSKSGPSRQPSTRKPSSFDKAFLTGLSDTGHLILVRHGQQQWPDFEKSVSGDWLDPPLSALGHRQAAATASYLSDESVDAIYSSPLARAHDTGLAIAEHHNLAVDRIDDLAEIHMFGHFPHDKRASEVIGSDAVKAASLRFLTTRRWDAFPGTESSLDFRRRTTLAIESILIRHPGETVVVACHGGVINAYLAELLNIGADMFFRPSHASVHRIDFVSERRVPVTLGSQEHLVGELLSH